MATLKLMRTPEKANSLADMVILLNGQELGSIANGETKVFAVAAGHHKLKARIDSQGSKSCHFTITEDKPFAFVLSSNKEANRVHPTLTGYLLVDMVWSALWLLYYFTLGHHTYITIKQLKGTASACRKPSATAYN